MVPVDESLYLAIDQGSHASRAIIFDARGGIQARGRAGITTVEPRADWVEHDPNEVLAATRQAIQESVHTLGARIEQVRAVGLATQRSSIVCWDRDSGQALSNVISWRDRRAADWLANYQNAADRIHAITGLVLSPHYGASKLRWCLDHLPGVGGHRARGRLAMGPLSSFLTFQLCPDQPAVADPANASRTLLWDFRTRDWSPELLALFGVPIDCLPGSVPSRHDFGPIMLGGLRRPMTVVTGDQSAALFGFGTPLPETVYANLGTGAFLQQVVGREPVAAPGLLSSVVYQDDRQSVYVLEGTVNGAGSAILAMADELRMDIAYLQANSGRWLATVAEPPLFLNGIGGLGSPYWLADFPSSYVGAGDTAARIVAVMESIVFLLAVNLEEFAKFAPPPHRMMVSGGLAIVDPLCQRLADVTQLPVLRPPIREATARGLAFLLAERPAGWATDSSQSAFEPVANPAVRQRYRRWRQAMEQTVATERKNAAEPDRQRPL
jgi:glycerol kinase